MDRDPLYSPQSARPSLVGSDNEVLLVAPQSFFTAAGTPINVLQMCRALTDLGYRIHLATFPMGNDIVMPGLHYHRAPRVPFVKQVPIGFSLAKALCDVVLAVKLLQLLRRHRFLAVHLVEEAAFFGVPLARLFGVRAITDLDSDIYEQLRTHRSFLARRLAGAAAVLRRIALRQSICAVTVAPSLTDLVAQVSPATTVFEIRDIPLGSAVGAPDPEAVQHLKQQYRLRTSRPVVYTGNFDARQGIDMLVRAMPLVRAKVSDATVLLVGGECHEIRRLRALTDSLGVSHAVRFAGKHAPELMPAFMALAAVLVSPRTEPLVTPLKIYSYMASGRPIVATDLPTHTHVLNGDSAMLVPATAEGIATGIIRTLNDPIAASQRAERAQQLIRQHHDFKHFRDRLSEVYEYVQRHPGTGSRQGGPT